MVGVGVVDLLEALFSLSEINYKGGEPFQTHFNKMKIKRTEDAYLLLVNCSDSEVAALSVCSIRILCVTRLATLYS